MVKLGPIPKERLEEFGEFTLFCRHVSPGVVNMKPAFIGVQEVEVASQKRPPRDTGSKVSDRLEKCRLGMC